MNAADSLYAGFADSFVPEKDFEQLRTALIDAGSPEPIAAFSCPPTEQGVLARWQADCDNLLAASDVRGAADANFADADMDKFWKKALAHNAPLSMLCTAEILHRLSPQDDVTTALDLEYRFTYRSMDEGEFLEGTRAAVIDKDRTPDWQYKRLDEVSDEKVNAMLAELPK